MTADWKIITDGGIRPGQEPVVWTETVRTILLLAMTFGLDLTDEQLRLVLVLVGVVAAWVARSRVAPVEPK